MINLAVGRGPSPLFGDAKLGTKKSPDNLCRSYELFLELSEVF